METIRRRWGEAGATGLVVGLLCAGAAAAGGLLLVFGGLPLTVAAVLTLAVALWMVRRVEVGFLAILAVVILLPFGALPVKIAVTPTFLDLALLGGVAVWWLHRSQGQEDPDPARVGLFQPAPPFELTPVGIPLLAFIGVAVFAFVLGLSNAPMTSNVVRHFAELLFSLSFFFVIANYVRDLTTLRWFVRALILLGAVAGLIGIILWVLPTTLSNDLLNRLQVFGYGGGDVLRYINDDPSLTQRAIGTSVDPNVFGGLLLVLGAIAGPQLVARRPILPRPVTIAAVGLIGLALLLTVSRGSLVGLGCALVFVGLIRYRRLLLILAVAALLLLLLPVTQNYVSHLIAGFQGADLATQMRFGEYSDALTLIGRYPLFGVGFTGAPDLDIYIGVSSLYLLIGEEMGLLGLVAFLAVVVTIFAYGWSARRELQVRIAAGDARAPELESLWLGLYAAMVGWLVSGIFDHYTISLDFQAAVTLIWIVVGLEVAASRLAHQGGAAPGQETASA